MIKMFNKLGIEGNYYNVIKTIHEKSTANFTFNGERLKALPLNDQEQDKAAHS